MSVNYFRQGNQFLWNNKLEEAIAAYRKTIEQNPNFYWGYHNLGEALEQLGYWEEAIEAYQQAVQLNSKVVCWSFLGLSRVLKQVGQVREAQKAWEEATKIEPKLAKMKSGNFPLSANQSTSKLTKTQQRINTVELESKIQQSKIVLFTPYYQARQPERQNELFYCLKKNIECPEIERIILLIDDEHKPEIESPKIEIINLSSRPTYFDWVELTKKKFPDRISILANTDIYFDQTVSRVREIFSSDPNAFVAISRYEQGNSEITLHKNPHWSQDAWAIHGQYEVTNALKNTLNIPLGVPRCDNKVSYLFAIRGAKIYNPCYYIKIVHIQKTDSRNYDKKNDTSILGGVAYVHPSPTLLKSSKLDVHLWAIEFSQIKEVKLNKSLEKWLQEQQQNSLEKGSSSSKTIQEKYQPKVDCLLFPMVKKEIDDLITYFNNVLLPTRQLNNLTIVISIDQDWDAKDTQKIREAITKSKAQPCIKEIKFISCQLKNFEAIYFRDIPENISTINLPDYGLKAGPNLQFFRSMHQLLNSEEEYNSILLQEVDTIPLRNYWLDFINKEIETKTDALLLGPIYSGKSQLKPEQVNHINGNAIYCLGNPCFPRFLKSWERLVIEVSKKAPWKSYDTVTEWVIQYLKDDSLLWIPKDRKVKDVPYFQSKELQEYLEMYYQKTYKLKSIINKAGPAELDSKTLFKPTSASEELKSASVLHLRPALPFRDICRYIANQDKLIESNVIGYDAFWQYPGITEKHAYKMAKKYLQDYDRSIVYFGFPWATLIDHLLHKPEDAEHFLLVLELYKPYLKKFTKVVTVCQHIHMLKFQYLFEKMGITDIFWSHTMRGQTKLPEFKQIKLHPFPLFPVQASNASPNDFRGVFRKFLFCFVGAKAPSYYLTEARNHIINYLASDNRGIIRSRDKWHYKKIVYEYQIRKTVSNQNNLVNQSQSYEFRNILKQSVFSLCPSGSGPNSIRLWESIGYGSIPVILSDNYLPPGDLDLWKTAAVFWPEKPDAIKALPDYLSELNQDKKLLEKKRNALQILWDRYGIGYFIYDIILYFRKYSNS